MAVQLLELGFGGGEGEEVLGMMIVDAASLLDGLTLSHQRSNQYYNNLPLLSSRQSTVRVHLVVFLVVQE